MGKIKTIQQSSDQVHCDIQGEKAILHTDSGIYYTLNEVGSFIWDQMAKPISFEAMVEKITGEFEIDDETAREDLQELIVSLEKEGLAVCETAD